MSFQLGQRGRIVAIVALTLALVGCKRCPAYERLVKVKKGDRILIFRIAKNIDHKVVFVVWVNTPDGLENVDQRDGDQTLDEVFEPGEIAGVGPATPTASAVTPSSTFFGVGAGSLVQFDVATAAAIRKVALGERLVDGAAGPDSAMLYVAALGPLGSTAVAPSIRIVDGTTFAAAGSIPLPPDAVPSGLDVTPDGKFLYVAARAASGPGVFCHVIDLTAKTILKTLSFPSATLANPEVVVSPDGGLVFVTANGVAVIDTLTQTLSHTIAEATGPHIAVDPTGTTLFVAPVRARIPNPNPPPAANFVDGVSAFEIGTSSLLQHFPVEQLGASEMRMALTLDGSSLIIQRLTTTGLIDLELKTVDTVTGAVRTYPNSSADGATIGPVLVAPVQ